MLIGKAIGPYAIDKELGSGAMGTVYRGRHRETGAKVAIKMVSPSLGASDNALKRFKRETEILRQLRHPNIVRLIASGRFQKAPFYAMEYVEGRSMDKILQERGRLAWDEVINLGIQLCAALQHAHDKGIVHRDLKPSNLMFLSDGTVKLTDFGIAKDLDETALTGANTAVGTAAYMSPEQCRGSRSIGPKSDLYSLGVVFYELLTGRKPFVADTAIEMFRLHLQATFQRPSYWVMDIPVWFDALIFQLMEKDPENRPYNAEAVARALEDIRAKMMAQQSAGLEAAKRRKMDRSAAHVALQAEDKEIARTLIGKKSRKKKVPIYRRGWFTVSAVSLVVATLGFVIYLVFIKPPSAESLYYEAQALMKSPLLDDRMAARDGPIHLFLEYYADSPQASTVRQWHDDVDRDDYDRALHKRRQNFKPLDDGERLAREALDFEDAGNLEEASKTWAKVAALQSDPKLRPWGLVGAKYLKELAAVDDLYGDLLAKVKADPKDVKPSSRIEEFAFKAAQSNAEIHWKDLRDEAKKNDADRRWYLLAAKRLRALSVQK